MNQKNTFVKEFSYMFLGTFLNLVIGVFTTPVITRLVDPTFYGQYSLFTTYVSITMSFFTLGLDQTLMRYFYMKEGVSYRKKIFQICCLVPAVTFACLSVIIVCASPIICRFTDNLDTWIISMFCVAVFISLLHRFALVLVRLEFKARTYAILNTLQRFSYLLMSVPYLLIFNEGNGFRVLVTAGILSNVVCILIAFIVERRFLFRKSDKASIDIPFSEMVRYGFPLMIASAVIHLFQAADKICVQYFGTLADVGVYASAQSLMSVFNIITTSFNTIWAPRAIEHYEKDPNDTSFYRKMNHVITLLMFVFGATVLIFKDIFVLLLGESYREAASIIPFLMFNPIMYTISETTVQGITFKKKTNNQVFISLGVCAFNYMLNMILIPIIGVVGAAVSTAVSYTLFFTLRTIVAGHYFKINWGLKKFYFLTAVFFANSAYQSTHSFDLVGFILYLFIVALTCVLYRDALKDLLDIATGIINKIKSRFHANN